MLLSDLPFTIMSNTEKCTAYLQPQTSVQRLATTTILLVVAGIDLEPLKLYLALLVPQPFTSRTTLVCMPLT